MSPTDDASGKTEGRAAEWQMIHLCRRLSTDESILAATNILQAVSYPLRLRIVVHLLTRGAATGGELSRHLGVSQSLAAHHLHHLRVAGLLQRRRRGNEVVYRASPSAADLLRAAIDCADGR